MQQESERRQKLANHQNEEEEEEDLEYGGGESLLSLVQPEMKTLSRHWLAALKDYALISLPQGKPIGGDGIVLCIWDVLSS